MLVTVTADDIADGRPGAPCACPLAMAISRALGYWVAVDGRDVWQHHGKGGRIAVLPAPAREFLRRFDARQPVAPFTFDLTAVS